MLAWCGLVVNVLIEPVKGAQKGPQEERMISVASKSLEHG